MVTGQNYAFVQHNWLTFAGLFHFRVARYATGCRSGLVNVVFTRRIPALPPHPDSRTRSVLNTWQRYGQHPDVEPPARHAVGLHGYVILMFCCTVIHALHSDEHRSLPTQLVAAPLLITVSGWRLLRYAMASSRALASRKVMLRP